MSTVLSAEAKARLQEFVTLAANAEPEAVQGILVNWLKGRLGALWADLVAAVKAGNLTPDAIITFLETIPGVTIPSWLPTVLEIILPIILSALTA